MSIHFSQLGRPSDNQMTTPTAINAFFREQSVLRALLKEFRDGVLICDRDSRIVQINRSVKKWLNLDDRVLGQFVGDAIPATEIPQAIDALMQEKSSRVEELVWRGDNGKKLFFELHLVPIWVPDSFQPNLNGHPPFIAAASLVPHFAPDEDQCRLPVPETIEDSPANEPAEQEAELGEPEAEPAIPDGCAIIFHNTTDIHKTEKMRRDFVANVSHELRTPLSAITGYSETLLDGALSDPQTCQEFIEVIHRHSLRLSQLVEDLLDLSKLESPDYEPELSPVSLRILIQQALLLVEDKAQEKGIHLSVDIPDPLPRVMAESSSMQQVLTNLLDNAIKYTPADGRVSISAGLCTIAHASFAPEQLQQKIRIDVSDNGPGIEAKYLPRIFERFYRVDKARSRNLGGTGLGLSIVKHIVQLHGDEITVSSTLQKGSTFSFKLNVAST